MHERAELEETAQHEDHARKVQHHRPRLQRQEEAEALLAALAALAALAEPAALAESAALAEPAKPSVEPRCHEGGHEVARPEEQVDEQLQDVVEEREEMLVVDLAPLVARARAVHLLQLAGDAREAHQGGECPCAKEVPVLAKV